MLTKIVVIKSCTQCPNAGFVTTRDPEHLRIYVGCDVMKKSFEYGAQVDNAVPIPDWCPLPDAMRVIDQDPTAAAAGQS